MAYVYKALDLILESEKIKVPPTSYWVLQKGKIRTNISHHQHHPLVVLAS